MARKVFLIIILIIYLRKVWREGKHLIYLKNIITKFKLKQILNVSQLKQVLNKSGKQSIQCFVHGYIQSKKTITGIFDKVHKYIYYAILKSYKYSNDLYQIKNSLDTSDKIMLIRNFVSENLSLKDINDNKIHVPIKLNNVDLKSSIREISTNVFGVKLNFLRGFYSILSGVINHFIPINILKGAIFQQVWSQVALKYNDYVTIFGICKFDKNNNIIIHASDILNCKQSFIDKIRAMIKKQSQRVIIFTLFSSFILILILNEMKTQIHRMIGKIMNNREQINEDLQSQDQVYQSVDEQKNNKFKCFICCDNVRKIIFKPCRHYGICKQCFKSMKKQSCPVCKQQIKSYIQVKKIKQYK